MTSIKPAVDLAAKAAIASRTQVLFRRSRALDDGHFVLSSGRHASAYLEKFMVLSDPAATSELCGLWAAYHRDETGRSRIDVVVGPKLGGAILAFETGRQLDCRALFAEQVHTEDGGTRLVFRRGRLLEPGDRVLLVDDIVTTGSALLSMIQDVEACGAEVVECAVMVDRSGGRTTFTSPQTGRVYPLRALWQVDLPTFEPGPDTCPRCAEGTPLRPGTGGVPA
jgi:orotate phosphoribosyltransferase